MFVASYRVGDGGEAEERERPGGRGSLPGRGGDGIDQVKYFTTHFRRCARRVARGGAKPGRLCEGQQKNV